MAVTLRNMYEGIGWFSTASHIEMCGDFLRKIKAFGDDNLARLFADAVALNSSFNQVARPFLDAELLASRKPLDDSSRGTNRVAFVMSNASPLTLTRPDPYTFRFLEREVPHLRAKTLKEQDDKGWIDYIAVTEGTPILGEIKYESDQNPFYAFIQLITYLSEMATANQIERAIHHHLFGDGVEAIASFDLHILLANFNDGGKKGKLIEPTHELAREFKSRLAASYPEFAQSVRNILCISAKIEDGQSECCDLDCLWTA